MEKTLLNYDSVEISFDGTPVVHDISFSLQPGEILGLVGESGSGKSTLIKAAMGLLGDNGLVTRGDITFRGKNLVDMPESELQAVRGAKIGMIFQDAGASLCPIRTIGEQIYESMRAHGKIVNEEAKEHALDLFAKLNFKEPERRAGIAISMLMNPPVLFADEPTSALDVAVQRQLVQEMLHVRDLFGTAIIIVTHDIGVVSAMADTVLVLKDGRKMEYGPAKEVLEHPQNDYTKELLSAVPKLRRSRN